MKTLIKGEKGYVLIAALLVLVILGLISGPLLSYMVSGLKAGHVFETGAAELYAADAGVQDAIWKIQNNIGLCAGSPTTHYTIADVNGKNVEVSVEYLAGGSYRITSTAVTEGGGNTADLGSYTTVESYVEAMAFDLLSGALVSMSDIDFSKDCVVTGDVYYVGEITGKEYEHIDGDEIQVPVSVFPTQEQNEVFAQQFKDQALLGETHLGTMTVDTDTTLNATYITGDLLIQKHGNDGVTVTLTGPIYVEGLVDVDMMSAITGSGSIVAVGDIRLAKLPYYGFEGDSIIMSLDGDITFKKEATIQALIYAPNGSVIVDKQLTAEGSIIAGYIDIKKDAYLTYVSKGSSFNLFPVAIYGAEIKTYEVIRN